MSKYADLRWKIADLEKELERVKNAYRVLEEYRDKKVIELYCKEKEIEELRNKIKSLVDNKKEREQDDR